MKHLITQDVPHSTDITSQLKETLLEEGMSLQDIVKLKKIEKAISSFFKDRGVKDFIIEEVSKENGKVLVDNVDIENRPSR